MRIFATEGRDRGRSTSNCGTMRERFDRINRTADRKVAAVSEGVAHER